MRRGYPELIAATIVWGSIGVVVKEIDVPAPAIVFVRLALGSAVVVAWFAARRRLAALRLGPARGLLVVAGVILALHWWLMFEAFKRLDVATTILVVYLGPVLMAAGAPVFLKERLERRTIVALGVSLGGIALITAPSMERLDGAGLAAAAGAAVLFAAVVLAGKRLTEFYEPPALVAWQVGIAAVVMIPGAFSASSAALRDALPELLLLGVVMTGVAGILYFRALARVKAQHVGILMYLEPVSAVLYAWALLSESPAALTLVGGALIVGAGATIVAGTAAPASLPEPPPDRALEGAR